MWVFQQYSGFREKEKDGKGTLVREEVFGRRRGKKGPPRARPDPGVSVVGGPARSKVVLGMKGIQAGFSRNFLHTWDMFHMYLWKDEGRREERERGGKEDEGKWILKGEQESLLVQTRKFY